MQVFLKYLPTEEGGVKEWAIIELQGDLGSREEASLDGQFVGDLHYTRDGIPILIIGHHILFGKVQKLEKPFAVLEKVTKDNEGDHEHNPMESKEFLVKCVIKRKLCFKERPKPIVGTFGHPKKPE